jgi:hypothetical protein
MRGEHFGQHSEVLVWHKTLTSIYDIDETCVSINIGKEVSNKACELDYS